MNRSELKRKAKESLKGKYFEAIKLYLLYFLICIGVSLFISIFSSIFGNSTILSLILSLVSTGIIYSLYAGFYSFFLKISRNEEVSYKELYNKLNLFGVTIGATLLVSLFSCLGMLLFIVPGIIIALNYAVLWMH